MKLRRNLNSSTSKRGNVALEAVTVLIILVVFALISFAAVKVMDDFSDFIMQDSDLSNTSQTEFMELEDRVDDTLDGAFVFAFGLLWLFVFLSAFMIDSHPAFFIISLILFIGILVVAGYISNAYDDIADDSELIATVNEFPMTNFILDNLLMFVLAVGASVAIALYAKGRSGV